MGGTAVPARPARRAVLEAHRARSRRGSTAWRPEATGVSGSEWVAVFAAQVCLVALVVLVVVIVRLDRARQGPAPGRARLPSRGRTRTGRAARGRPHRRLRARSRRRHRLRRRARRRPGRRRLRPRLPHLHQPGGQGPRRRHRHPARGPAPQGREAGAEARRGILMFKRVTWLGVGFTLGAATTVVAARKARQQLDRYKPPALVDRVTTTITTKTTTLKDQVVVALNEGRSAAKDREPNSAKKKASTIVPDPAPPLPLPLPRSSSPARRSRAALEGEAARAVEHARGVEDDEPGPPTVGPVGARPGSKSHAEERGVQGLGRRKGPCRGTSTATVDTVTKRTPGRRVRGGGYDLSRVPASNRR